MDEELHCAFCLPHLPDSPPGAREDTPPGHVSGRDNDLELSHSGASPRVCSCCGHDYAATEDPQIAATMCKLKAAICFSPNKMASCNFYLVVIIFYLFANFS